MDFKLIAFGLVFGIAALIVYAASRANSPEARRKAGPSLDTQIGTLAEMGLTLSPGLTRDDLLAWGPEETYRADPWRLILMTYASPADHLDDRPFCPRAAMIDMEGADNPDRLARLTRDLARVADLTPGQGGTLDEITDDLDRRLPDGTHLWALDNGQALAIFRLTDADAETLNAEHPGLLAPLIP